MDLKKRRTKKSTALMVANPYLADPKFREYMTVTSVHNSNKLEGIDVPRKVTRENYRLVVQS